MSDNILFRSVTAALALCVFAGSADLTAVHAQDVEMLGRIYGKRPPQAYFSRVTGDPDAFTFQRALIERTAPRRGQPGGGDPDSRLERASAPLGQRDAPVSGTFTFPMVLGLYADTPGQGPHSAATAQRHFFDGPNATGTITDFYREMSDGRVTLKGEAFDWIRSAWLAEDVAGGSSGLGSGARVGEFIVDIVAQLDSSGVDWGRFDNDGPDGVPNSGDDDGFVDVLMILHPTSGAECSGDEESDRVWSHRWNLVAQAGGPYKTFTPAATGGFIHLDDYTIQPMLSCDGVAINEIGVFAHELGHGFGLPDLYGVGGSDHAGIGKWGLMGSGSWGCPGPFDPARPCAMGAWSKLMMGWVDEVVLAPDLDHGLLTLPPVESTRRVYRVAAGDGSDEYLLLENRQKIGFDAGLTRSGLLVWHVDEGRVQARWSSNTVNADPAHMGVWLRQADGVSDLTTPGRGRGDAGDPFPGATGKTVLHAGSTPSTLSHEGGGMGITLLDIEEIGTNLRFRLLTRFQSIALQTVGARAGVGLISVDGVAPASFTQAVRSAPFQPHQFQAVAGDSIGPGVRVPFLEWDDGSRDRTRDFVTGLSDTTLVARFSGTEYRVAPRPTSAVEGIAPGTVTVEPPGADGWHAPNETVTVTAVARTGFAFREWGGTLAGAPNPVTRTLSGPLLGEALFDVVYGVSDSPLDAEIEAATPAEISFQVENANLPVEWTIAVGDLPSGIDLAPEGTLVGAALESGTFPLTLSVSDAIGLTATVPFTLEVTPPQLGVHALVAPLLLNGDPAPTALQRAYLDGSGNRNGAYDVGDFRAFLLANPGIPMSAEMRSIVRVLVPPVRLERGRQP